MITEDEIDMPENFWYIFYGNLLEMNMMQTRRKDFLQRVAASGAERFMLDAT
jgi:hypothetical protein